MDEERKLTVLDQITASEEVRRKIIDAASVLYSKKGFKATSIQEISELAGVSLPVTYHYIKSKSEIMSMIMEDLLKSFKKSLSENLKGFEDPEEKLACAVVNYFKIVDINKEKALVIYQKSISLDKPSKAKIMSLEVDVTRIFVEILEEGIQKGVFRSVDTDLMAYNIVMLAHMWALKQWHFKKRLTIDEYINHQLKTILASLRVEKNEDN